mgnify:CR=1 FL=1
MKKLVYGNRQCPETIEELQQVKMAAATVRGTPGVFLRIGVNMLRRAKACIASRGQHFQHL